jgi:hypothetical protein
MIDLASNVADMRLHIHNKSIITMPFSTVYEDPWTRSPIDLADAAVVS